VVDGPNELIEVMYVDGDADGVEWDDRSQNRKDQKVEMWEGGGFLDIMDGGFIIRSPTEL